MSVKLTKGQRINLKKTTPNLNQILVGIGWDPVKSFFSFFSKDNMDIDASVICIDSSSKFKNIVYFGNLSAYSGAIKHYGNALTVEGNGDNEQIEIELNNIPDDINRLLIIINIYRACKRHQDFSQIKNCFVHITDLSSGIELVRYNVDGNFDDKTGIFVADLYRYNGAWNFHAIGEGDKVNNITEMIKRKCR